jgi:hypothetical protein
LAWQRESRGEKRNEWSRAAAEEQRAQQKSVQEGITFGESQKDLPNKKYDAWKKRVYENSNNISLDNWDEWAAQAPPEFRVPKAREIAEGYLKSGKVSSSGPELQEAFRTDFLPRFTSPEETRKNIKVGIEQGELGVKLREVKVKEDNALKEKTTGVDAKGEFLTDKDISVYFSNKWKQYVAMVNGTEEPYDSAKHGKKSVKENTINTEWEEFTQLGKEKGWSRETLLNKWDEKVTKREASKTTARTQATLDVYDPYARQIAGAIFRGEQPPDVGGFGMARYAGQVRAILAEDNYNLTNATLDWKATQKHLQTLNGAQQVRLRQATQFAYDSLDLVEQYANEWDAGGFPILNKVNLKLALNGVYGTKANQIAQKLDTQISDLTSELGTVYKGGNSSTDESLKLAAKNLNSSWSRDVLISNINLCRTNLRIRQNSMKLTGPAGIIGDPSTKPSADPLGIR